MRAGIRDCGVKPLSFRFPPQTKGSWEIDSSPETGFDKIFAMKYINKMKNGLSKRRNWPKAVVWGRGCQTLLETPPRCAHVFNHVKLTSLGVRAGSRALYSNQTH